MPAPDMGGFSLIVVAGEDPAECSAVCAAVGRRLREAGAVPEPGGPPRVLACASPASTGSGGAAATGILCAAEALCAAARLEGLHDTIFEAASALVLLTDGGLCSCGPPGAGAPPCGCGALLGTGHVDGGEHLSSASLSLLMASSLLGPSPPCGVSICSARGLVHLPSTADAAPPPAAAQTVTLYQGRAHPAAQPGAWGDGKEALLLHLSPAMCAKLMAQPPDCCTSGGADSGVRAQRKCAFHDIAQGLGGEVGVARRDLCVASVPASAEGYRGAVAAPGTTGPCILNSVLRCEGGGVIGDGSVVEGCVCEGKLAVGDRSLVRGLHAQEDVSVGDGVLLAQVRVRDGRSALVFVGLGDDIAAHKDAPNASLLGKPWSALLAHASEEQIWPAAVPANERCLNTAKLFPLVGAEAGGGVRVSLVMPLGDPGAATDGVEGLMKLDRVSLRDLRDFASPHKQAEWNRGLQLRRDAEWANAVLRGHSNDCLLPAIRRSATPLDGFAGGDDFSFNWLFAVFERCAADSDHVVAARAMACIADWLAARGGDGWGLRSGPGRHAEWSPALDAMYACEGTREGILQLGKVRRRWLTQERASPAEFIRSARHYESAAQVLTRKAVETCGNLDERVAGERPPIGETVAMDVPARIDLAGGWLDTPPICYEVGGMVVNAALKLDGKLPIGARATRTEEMVLRLQVEEAEDVTCSELDHLMDYNNPSSPAALLKAALVCAGVISVKDGAPPLKEQLLSTLGSGLHIETWSRVPRGSGLGTSSILAGAILVVIGKAMGKMYTPEGCIHAVMIVEQLLTTGGGWQDQCGGLYPGIKCCRSAPSLPLTVTTEVLDMPADALARINSHLVLVYTGKARLAKTLLQDVLRRWHARLPAVTANLLSLKATAAAMREAVLKGDVAAMGRHMGDYWEEKKRMAPGAEPPLVTFLIQAVRDECHGVSVAGAGGGGLLVLLTKKQNISDRIQGLVRDLGGVVHKAEVYSGAIFPP